MARSWQRSRVMQASYREEKRSLQWQLRQLLQKTRNKKNADFWTT
jgi:hypothetical protein